MNSAVDKVRRMKESNFGHERWETLEAFIRDTVQLVERNTGIELEVAGATEAELCESFISAAKAAGLEVD